MISCALPLSDVQLRVFARCPPTTVQCCHCIQTEGDLRRDCIIMGWPFLACVALPIISLVNLMFPFIKSARKEFPRISYQTVGRRKLPGSANAWQTMSDQDFIQRMNILSQRYKDTRRVENKFVV